jgi:alpha-mannosidase
VPPHPLDAPHADARAPDTYTAQASVGDVNKGVTNHKNLESSASALLVFGNGDGGGGPLAKMLENVRRCLLCGQAGAGLMAAAAAADPRGGERAPRGTARAHGPLGRGLLPRPRGAHGPRQDAPELVRSGLTNEGCRNDGTWRRHGELYLEFHRGTYTSHGVCGADVAEWRG